MGQAQEDGRQAGGDVSYVSSSLMILAQMFRFQSAGVSFPGSGICLLLQVVLSFWALKFIFLSFVILLHALHVGLLLKYCPRLAQHVQVFPQ